LTGVVVKFKINEQKKKEKKKKKKASQNLSHFQDNLPAPMMHDRVEKY